MNIMKKALFIDRDGTLIKEPADEQIDAFEKLEFVPGVMRNLAFIRQKLDYEFVMGLQCTKCHYEKIPYAYFSMDRLCALCVCCVIYDNRRNSCD